MVIDCPTMLRLGNVKKFKKQESDLQSLEGKESLEDHGCGRKQLSEIKEHDEKHPGDVLVHKTSLSNCILSIKESNSKHYDFIILQRKINGLIMKYIGAESCLMAFPTKDPDMMYIRVIGESDVGPITFSVVGSVLQSRLSRKEPPSTVSKKLNEEHHQLFEQLINKEITSTLLIPICFPEDRPNSVAFIVFLFNKQNLDSNTNAHPQQDFNEHDEKVVKKVFQRLCPLVLRSITLHKESIRKEKKLNLLSMGRTKCAVSQLSQTIIGLMKKAKCIVCAEKCSFFIVDAHRQLLVAKILEEMSERKRQSTLIFSVKQAIFAKVISTGNPVLINHIRRGGNKFLFNKGLECFQKQTNALFFPVKNKGEVLAVGGFSNKIGDLGFTMEDRDLCVLLAGVIKRVALGTLLDFLRWN